MNVNEAITKAEKILPGTASVNDEDDPRWQAIIKVGEFVKSNPEEVWKFALKWGSYKDDDIRMAIATCILEHLFEYHFDLIFSKVKEEAKKNHLFYDTFMSCFKFGQASQSENSKLFDELKDNYYKNT